jgi:hypothetical protein
MMGMTVIKQCIMRKDGKGPLKRQPWQVYERALKRMRIDYTMFVVTLDMLDDGTLPLDDELKTRWPDWAKRYDRDGLLDKQGSDEIMVVFQF